MSSRPWITLAALVLTALPVSAGVRSPLQGTGELEFLADMPVFFDEDGDARVDLAVRLDHEQLEPGVTKGGSRHWVRDVLVTLKLAREGVVAVDTVEVYRVVGERIRDKDPTVQPFELLELSVPVPEGRWAATIGVAVLRENTQDDGINPLVAVGFGAAGVVASELFEAATFAEVAQRRARVSGVLSVPRWPEGVARLSDPEYRIRTTNGALPHPERLYGVSQDTLETYVEIAGAPVDRIARVGVEIHDREFGQMDATTIEITPRTGVDATLVRMPLALLPDGNYVLRLVPSWTEDVVLESEFVVSWKIERAVQARDDVMVEAELVLPPDDFARFARMSRPVQIQAMQRFWDERDPTPGTSKNELYERFLARVAYTARFYGEAQRPGPITDRGKIYIRYGAPSEVEVNVMPASDYDLETAIGQVHDAFAIDVQGWNARETINEGGALKFAQPDNGMVDAEEVQDLRRNSMRIGREASFELWRYEGQGEPLFEDTMMWSEDIDLRFLFVDRNGIGNYRLDYSNADQHH